MLLPPPQPRRTPFPLPRMETVLLVALLVVGGLIWTYRAREVPGELRSVAVLPFENVTGDPAQDFFSQGVSDEIRTSLSRLPGLQVASRTSSFGMAGERGSAREIAGELGVTSLLEGTVQRAEGRVRVTVSLVDARTDRQLWTETFDRVLSVENLFAVQEEIAQAVARQLEVELGGRERLVREPPRSLEAHELYLLGLYHWNRRTGPEVERAVEFFREAVRQDPDYALAHAGLAKAYVLLPLYAGVPASSAMPQARAAARQALALDSTLAEAHAAAALVATVHDYDWDAAEAGFRRAVELDSTYATAWEWYAVTLDARGRYREARPMHERARALDPHSVVIRTVFGSHLTFNHAYDEAVAELGGALDLQADLPLALRFLAEAHILAGRPGPAGEALRRMARAQGHDPEGWDPVIRGLRDPSARQEGIQAVEALAGQGRLDRVLEAQYYTFLGATTAALDALETGYRERDFLLFLIDADPAFDRYDGDPRFDALLGRMGLG